MQSKITHPEVANRAAPSPYKPLQDNITINLMLHHRDMVCVNTSDQLQNIMRSLTLFA